MASSDATVILLRRIQMFETDHAPKIFGFLLLRHSPEEILRFSSASDHDILLLIKGAKESLNYNAPRLTQQQLGIGPFGRPAFQPDQVLPLGHNLVPLSPPSHHRLPNTSYFSDHSSRICTRPRAEPQYFPYEQCYYFKKGYCKEGSNCRFRHEQGVGLCSPTQGSSIGSSKKLFLTFPADSSFTENDAGRYFDQYGPVLDVWFPRQTRRRLALLDSSFQTQ